MNKRTLFALWGILFLLCAGLGFLPVPSGWTGFAALVFFLPPAMLLYRHRDLNTLLLVRNLSALSLSLTLLCLILNFLCALRSEFLGTAIHYILVIVSSPMICSGHWAASLFLWACLLLGSLKLLKQR